MEEQVTESELLYAHRQHLKQSPFTPKISELLKIIEHKRIDDKEKREEIKRSEEQKARAAEYIEREKVYRQFIEDTKRDREHLDKLASLRSRIRHKKNELRRAEEKEQSRERAKKLIAEIDQKSIQESLERQEKVKLMREAYELYWPSSPEKYETAIKAIHQNFSLRTQATQ